MRNQYRARGISSGTTFFFVSPSIVPANGPFTQLKKYSMPIQAIPARMCIQRDKASRISTVAPLSPCGAALLPPGHREVVPPVSRPALFAGLPADRHLFAVGHGLHPVGGHAQRDQVVERRARAP